METFFGTRAWSAQASGRLCSVINSVKNLQHEQQLNLYHSLQKNHWFSECFDQSMLTLATFWAVSACLATLPSQQSRLKLQWQSVQNMCIISPVDLRTTGYLTWYTYENLTVFCFLFLGANNNVRHVYLFRANASIHPPWPPNETRRIRSTRTPRLGLREVCAAIISGSFYCNSTQRQ